MRDEQYAARQAEDLMPSQILGFPAAGTEQRHAGKNTEVL